MKEGADMQQIKRGDIWYIERGNSIGSEQCTGRPAVVVSNDSNNKFSGTIEVVYLTTQPKKDLPTHAIVNSSERKSIAICEQVTTVAVERLGDYKGHVTDEEMADIEAAILVSLDIQNNVSSVSEANFIRVKAELAALQRMYNELLDRFITVRR